MADTKVTAKCRALLVGNLSSVAGTALTMLQAKINAKLADPAKPTAPVDPAKQTAAMEAVITACGAKYTNEGQVTLAILNKADEFLSPDKGINADAVLDNVVKGSGAQPPPVVQPPVVQPPVVQPPVVQPPVNQPSSAWIATLNGFPAGPAAIATEPAALTEVLAGAAAADKSATPQDIQDKLKLVIDAVDESKLTGLDQQNYFVAKGKFGGGPATKSPTPGSGTKTWSDPRNGWTLVAAPKLLWRPGSQTYQLGSTVTSSGSLGVTKFKPVEHFVNGGTTADARLSFGFTVAAQRMWSLGANVSLGIDFGYDFFIANYSTAADPDGRTGLKYQSSDHMLTADFVAKFGSGLATFGVVAGAGIGVRHREIQESKNAVNVNAPKLYRMDDSNNHLIGAIQLEALWYPTEYLGIGVHVGGTFERFKEEFNVIPNTPSFVFPNGDSDNTGADLNVGLVVRGVIPF